LLKSDQADSTIRFLRVFLERGKDREFCARLVNYADDFVILSRGRAESALAWTRRVITAIGLTLYLFTGGGLWRRT
jgi:hypothetical protein